MMINSFIVAGRLTKSVQYGATTNGIPAARFNLANNRGKHTNYFRVLAYNRTADYAKDYLHSGQRVTVQGKMQHNQTNVNGTYHDYYTVIADTFDPVHPKSTKQNSSVRKLYAKFDDLSKKIDAASGTLKPKQHQRTTQKRAVHHTKKTARK